ncbi:MAG: YkgJ family cysteine cluster protein [Desulfovibrio sp.]|nr:YkgJ family cysteine cluster protein [Desulfovibrio sp.]
MTQNSFCGENLPDIPTIGKDQNFRFGCGPDSPCFNRCCRDLLLPLTPYDVARARRSLGVSGSEFLTAFAESRVVPETGLPLPILRMIESPSRECPFVTPAGCSVYEDRPGACRLYPLGRSASVGADGAKERFLLAAESYCQGWGRGSEYTPETWTLAQDMRMYNYFNDRYMRLMTLIAAGGEPLNERVAGLAFLCLYQLESFRELILKMKIFSRVEVDEKRRSAIMNASLAGDEACLDFAFDWLELAIFGIAEKICPSL